MDARHVVEADRLAIRAVSVRMMLAGADPAWWSGSDARASIARRAARSSTHRHSARHGEYAAPTAAIAPRSPRARDLSPVVISMPSATPRTPPRSSSAPSHRAASVFGNRARDARSGPSASIRIDVAPPLALRQKRARHMSETRTNRTLVSRPSLPAGTPGPARYSAGSSSSAQELMQ